METGTSVTFAMQDGEAQWAGCPPGRTLAFYRTMTVMVGEVSEGFFKDAEYGFWAPSSATTTEELVMPDADLVAEMCANGYPEAASQRSCIAVKNEGYEAAKAYLIAHCGDAGINEPLPDPKPNYMDICIGDIVRVEDETQGPSGDGGRLGEQGIVTDVNCPEPPPEGEPAQKGWNVMVKFEGAEYEETRWMYTLRKIGLREGLKPTPTSLANALRGWPIHLACVRDDIEAIKKKRGCYSLDYKLECLGLVYLGDKQEVWCDVHPLVLAVSSNSEQATRLLLTLLKDDPQADGVWARREMPC
eukprot:gnl/MRDRNA2_/MRDRNA2_33306_c0_seq1.p2 gnl/MRDRNA2_/MRDRNA2_33306_c0~~gnl/MRDRNA2_/MRDRNA2_33306_c0_seq1.p2  ORF type:complete len:302 (-),score=53.15 gnl/MRDRNA2_/MRDRNA2_33306_c0_seq1:240-1145(-)